MSQSSGLIEWGIMDSLFSLPDKLVPTAWAGHVPFLFSIFRLARPRSYVELGVYNGASFIAACSAARKYNTDTICFGLDTWAGDDHAGDYSNSGDGIYTNLSKYLASMYPPAKLMRGFFKDSLGQFSDGTIDLLHIDGLHTYDAVRQDYEMWLPKMSRSGIVMFHDIAVRERNFGVWKLWEEIKDNYPNLEFYHCFGLGVLFVGADQPVPIRHLIDLWTKKEPFREMFRSACEQTGAILPDRLQARVNEERVRDVPGRDEVEKLRETAWHVNQLVCHSRGWRILAPALRRMKGFRNLERG